MNNYQVPPCIAISQNSKHAAVGNRQSNRSDNGSRGLPMALNDNELIFDMTWVTNLIPKRMIIEMTRTQAIRAAQQLLTGLEAEQSNAVITLELNGYLITSENYHDMIQRRRLDAALGSTLNLSGDD